MRPSIPFQVVRDESDDQWDAPKVSPLASVDKRAVIEPGVEIGPFCMIGPDVTIGAGTILHNNVTVIGNTIIGKRNRIHANSVIGGEPQDHSYRGTPTRVEIGNDNTFREGVTINRGTEKEVGLTYVGDHNYLMAGCHIAHDCHVGNHVTMANGCMLGGHVHIHDHVTFSGVVAVHHFVSVGSFCFVAGLSRVIQDSPPFMLCDGIPSRPRKVNLVALRRNHFPNSEISSLTEAYRLLYHDPVGTEKAKRTLAEQGLWCDALEHLFLFLEHKLNGIKGRGRDQRRKAA
jgi:UDP-N-acetylglucosamine acyltransferase